MKRTDFLSSTSPENKATEAWILCKAEIKTWQCELEQVLERSCILEPLKDLPFGIVAEKKLSKNMWLCSCFFPWLGPTFCCTWPYIPVSTSTRPSKPTSHQTQRKFFSWWILVPNSSLSPLLHSPYWNNIVTNPKNPPSAGKNSFLVSYLCIPIEHFIHLYCKH